MFSVLVLVCIAISTVILVEADDAYTKKIEQKLGKSSKLDT